MVPMKILFISSRFPSPALKGDQVILSNRLRHLSKNHDVTLLTFYQHDKELKDLEQVRQYCVNVETVKMGKLESICIMLTLSVFSRLPFQTLYFKSDKFCHKLKQILDSTDFDLVHTCLLRMAEYSRHIDKPKVLDLIDCMQLNLGNRRAFVKHPLKMLYDEELQRIKRYEKEVLNDFDSSIVVSDTDRIYLDSEKAMTIPLGIDTDRYRRHAPLPDNRTIIFSGNMAYYPNESAILWFIDNCFDLIRQRVPEVKLKIVGSNPGNTIKKYHDDKTIIVTGFVESIVDEMTTSQIAIAPMQSGYGMHIKILEAMSCGLPVVTTTSGRGTISAEHQVHLLVADDWRSFAEACIELLTNQSTAESIGKNARDLIVREYGWESSVAQLERTYEAILRKREKRNDERKMQNFK